MEPDGRIGGFRVIKPLGEGARGTVFLAEDEELRRLVALKFLKPDQETDPRIRERFRREGRVAAALKHPGIAVVHSLGEHDGSRFLVYEYVEGTTLQEEIGRGAFPAQEVVFMGLELAQALQHVHSQGIVHRDLKASNVMLTREGTLKILDFGLASSPEFSKLTESGVIPASPAYLSPELLRGQKASSMADLWAFGVLLYQCTTGSLPFLGSSELNTMYQILHEPPIPPSSFVRDIPPELESIIQRMLEKKISRRYESVQDIHRRLDALWQELST